MVRVDEEPLLMGRPVDFYLFADVAHFVNAHHFLPKYLLLSLPMLVGRINHIFTFLVSQPKLSVWSQGFLYAYSSEIRLYEV